MCASWHTDWFRFLILVCLVNFSILWEGFEFIKGASGEPCFSTSKDDSLDKKQIQIIVVIVVKVVKLIFNFETRYSLFKNQRKKEINLDFR